VKGVRNASKKQELKKKRFAKFVESYETCFEHFWKFGYILQQLFIPLKLAIIVFVSLCPDPKVLASAKGHLLRVSRPALATECQVQ